jgi:Mg-chelatase subunit ChlD
VHTLVIDCERSPVRLDRAPLLAAALGADYLPLDPR